MSTPVDEIVIVANDCALQDVHLLWPPHEGVGPAGRQVMCIDKQGGNADDDGGDDDTDAARQSLLATVQSMLLDVARARDAHREVRVRRVVYLPRSIAIAAQRGCTLHEVVEARARAITTTALRYRYSAEWGAVVRFVRLLPVADAESMAEYCMEFGMVLVDMLVRPTAYGAVTDAMVNEWEARLETPP